MRQLCLIVFSILLTASFICAQQDKPKQAPEDKANPPATTLQPVPVGEVRQSNPVKSSPESIASGKKIFGYDCALCHGEAGDGKGDVLKDMKVPDLTDPASLKNRTDGEIFYRIKVGHAGMPPEGDRVKADHLWNLVNYVRSLSASKAEKSK
jgi:mono/diheme cytochrome c family protein